MKQGKLVDGRPQPPEIFLPEIFREALQRPIAFHRIFAAIADGSAMAGLFLSQAWYWHTRTADPQGWFYKTQQEWQEETALDRYEQERARKILRRVGILEEERRGIPAKLYYRLNEREILQSSMRVSAYRKADSRIQESGFPQSIPEITSETTAEKKPPVLLRKTSPKRQKPLPVATQQVLDYLNDTLGRRYRVGAHITQCLAAGYTPDDACLVIRWLHVVRRVYDAEWVERYLDNVTPFRVGNFDKYLAKARQWQEQGHPGVSRHASTRDVVAELMREKEAWHDTTRNGTTQAGVARLGPGV